ncbi:MAG TPA: glycoside hydrolase family 30 protein [Cyclobacteriaceae bacterium]|jgi:glucosylceramidase|nr:glycoside hydrolase family 30 protein [Cyclobacteriaceae bacterium]
MKSLAVLLLSVASCAIGQVKDKVIKVYTSADNSELRFTKSSSDLHFTPLSQPLETQSCVFVYPSKRNQTFLGIGGAITDASAEVFAKLPKEKQEEFLNAYFSKDKGLGYSLLRTNINSCDFSSDNYTYVKDGDKDLNSFSIEHDRQFKIPLIKKAMERSGNVTIYASPWSPPSFMKSNKDMLHGGKLLPEFYDAWANYYVKFIKAYEAEKIPIWGISVQNEPMATQRWESCIYSAEDERDFLKRSLGPVMEKSGLQRIKIIVWDHNRDLITQRATTLLDDAEANKYVWGVGFHWYEPWSGGDPMFDNVAKVNRMYPDKNLLFTEGCVESFDAKKYQWWANGERYGRSMINDFNNGTVGWTDWNILLDENGGPNHAKNFCFAPIHADTKTSQLIYTPSYYFIGHFSKFIKPGAKCVASSASRSQLLSTSFVNPDGETVTVVMNPTNKQINYFLDVESYASEVVIPAKAIQTLVY